MDVQAARGELRRGLVAADQHADLGSRDGLKQAVDDEPAELAAGAGDEETGGGHQDLLVVFD